MMVEKIRVLCVDDETALLDLCKVFLERSDEFMVTTATSAPDAILLLEQERFDTIVSDYQMPEMNGIEFLKELRARENTTPFIIFTGKGREEVVIEALNAGADFYIQKGGEPKAQFAELAHKIKKGVEGRRTKRAFIDSEEKYRRIVDTADEGIGLLDNQFRITYANRRMAEMLGYTLEGMIGKEIRSFMPIGELADYSVRMKLQREGVHDHFERQFLRKDGSILWTSVSITPVTDTNGNFLGSVTMYADITERKRAEEALHAKEHQLSSIFNNVTEILYFISVEPDFRFRFVSVNRSFLDATGLSEDQVAGRYVDEVIPEPSLTMVLENYKQAIREKKTVRWFEVSPYPSGTKYGHVAITPIYDGNGHCTNLVGSVHDITELKIAEEELRISEEKFRHVFDGANDAILLHTLTTDGAPGRFIDANLVACRMLGYSRDELLAMGPPDIVPPEIRPQLDDIIQKAYTTDTVLFETKLRRKDGTTFPVESSGHHVTYDGKRIWISHIRDITGRKRAEEALQISNEKYMKAFLSVPDAITISELDSGRFIEVNDEATRIFGYSRDELIGKSVVELGIWPKKERDLFINLVRTHGRVSRFEMVEWRKSGEPFHVLVNADTITIGNVPCLIAIIHDITERKRAEEALKKSQMQLAEAMDLANLVNWEFDVASGLFTFNDRFYALYGTTADREGGYLMPAGVYAREFVHPDEVHMVANEVRNAITSTDPYYTTQVEHRIIRRDGEIRHIIVRYGITKDTEGRTIKTHGANQDITERTRAEEALRKSEEKFQSLYMHMIEGAALHELTYNEKGVPEDYVIIETNPAFEKQIGIPRDSVIGKTSRAAYGVAEPPYLAIYSRVALTGAPEVFETYFTPIAKHLSISVFSPHKGSFATIFEDITERRKVEEALREREERYREFFTISRDSVFITSPDGRFIDFNDTLVEMFGFDSREEMFEAPVASIYAQPEERTAFNQHIIREGYVKEYPIQGKKKNGTIFNTLITTVPVRNQDGSLKAFIGTIRDVTEQKRAEQENRTLLQFQESIIKNANIWISVLDGKGNVSIWNRAAEEISGYGADEVIGRNTIWRLMYPDNDYRRSVTAKIKEILGSSKYLENFETRIRTKDGHQRIIWWNTRVLHDIPRIEDTFIAIGKDVTEQKTLQDAVQQANKKLNLLSSITRHDILNQLMVLKGYLAISLEEVDNPAVLTGYIKKGERAARTIEEQITFTRDYQELGIAAPEWQSMHACIEKAFSGLPMRDVIVEVDRSDREICADLLLENVFSNLIDNALRYGGDKMKTIRVSTQESDTGLTIVCEDDGVGITEEDKKRLFTQGFGKNTGLGLFLSREILSITGITIIENGIPGRGARFEITVPRGMYRFGKNRE